jgi:hypothetical protein
MALPPDAVLGEKSRPLAENLEIWFSRKTTVKKGKAPERNRHQEG